MDLRLIDYRVECSSLSGLVGQRGVLFATVLVGTIELAGTPASKPTLIYQDSVSGGAYKSDF